MTLLSSVMKVLSNPFEYFIPSLKKDDRTAIVPNSNLPNEVNVKLSNAIPAATR
jgi:hypothetical protein